MPAWLATLIPYITTALTALFAALQTRKLRAAEAKKAEAEAQATQTTEQISTDRQLTGYIDELLKDRVRMSKEHDAANDIIRGYETKFKLQDNEIAALKKRVEALEHLDKTIKALGSYPKFADNTSL